MANIGSILKRIFIREVEETSPGQNDEQTDLNRSDKADPDEPHSTTQRAPAGEPSGELMEKFRNIFQKTLDEHDMEGFDYLEFRHSLKSMQNISGDEATCFQSIFATAQTLGASKKSLIQSVDYYRKVLKQEKSKFEETLAAQKHKRKETLDEQLEEERKALRKKREHIETLRREIDGHEERMEEISRMIAESDQRITTTRRAFEHTLLEFLERMEEDREKIKQYIDDSNDSGGDSV